MSKPFDKPGAQSEDAAMPYEPREESSRIAAARQKHEQQLLAIDGVEGVGQGRDQLGNDAIVVYVRDRSVSARIPAQIDGIPVRVEVTGIIDAYGKR